VPQKHTASDPYWEAGNGEMVRQERTARRVIVWAGKPHLEQGYKGKP